MAVKIKLARIGKIRTPHYRVIVADARTRRSGRPIETIGIYEPKSEPARRTIIYAHGNGETLAHIHYFMAHQAELHCQRLLLTHMSSDMLAHLDDNTLEAEPAHDGLSIDL